MSTKLKFLAVFLAGSMTLVGCGGGEEQPRAEETVVSTQQSNETEVPELEGKTLNQAIRSIRDANLTYELTNEDFDVEKERHNTKEWVVEKQDQAAGTSVPDKYTVKLSLKRK